MNITMNLDPTDWALLQELPFAGLGFDLAGAIQRAELMTLVPVAEPVDKAERKQLAAPVYGYALQLMLGREVRAG